MRIDYLNSGAGDADNKPFTVKNTAIASLVFRERW